MKIYCFVPLFFLLILSGCASTKKTNPNATTSVSKESEIPLVTKPKVNCSQVPDTIDGNKWIEKHRVCIIDSPSTWSR